jgi:hypothetical protein
MAIASFMMAHPSATPIPPPTTASVRLSVSSCANTCRRDAPIADRSASSC